MTQPGEPTALERDLSMLREEMIGTGKYSVPIREAFDRVAKELFKQRSDIKEKRRSDDEILEQAERIKRHRQMLSEGIISDGIVQ